MGSLSWAVVVAVAMLVGVGVVAPRRAEASNARSEVVLAIERLETKIRETRWHFNNLSERKALETELALLHRLYDRIIEYEGILNAYPCAGALITGKGPPVSTEASDRVGVLAQPGIPSGRQRGGKGKGASRAGSDGAAGKGNRGGFRVPGFNRFVFLRAITDVEVRLIVQMVYAEDRIANERWHFNNQAEYKALIAARDKIKAELRRLRNSRC